MSNISGILILTGSSGKDHLFEMFPFETSFKAIGGVYYISKRTGNSIKSNTDIPLCIGQTSNLSERIDRLHKEDCFKRNGANCISIYFSTSQKERLDMERDLIKNYNLTCKGN